jgi:serine/threonine protein kinase
MESETQGPERLVGRFIAGYQLEHLLGAGASGAVFLGRRAGGMPTEIEKTGVPAVLLPGEAAIKLLLLPPQMSVEDRADIHARFLREAELLQRLIHPRIVSVKAFGEDDGQLYMVLSYLPGGTLADRFASQADPMPLPEVASILGQVAEALDYAHAQGVIHRDIKPANVLLDQDGNASLADFSIARLQELQTRHTTTGRILGTLAYMAPEQARRSAIGPATDIYSLGCLVFQMVTGHVPFTSSELAQLIMQHVQEPPPDPRSLRPDLPEPAGIRRWTARRVDGRPCAIRSRCAVA